MNVAQSKSPAQLLRIPLVKEAAAVYFFVTLLRSAVSMWLPIYLHMYVGYSKPDAGWVSLAYEGGALLGVPGLAILSDALLGGRKMLGVQLALALSAGSLMCFYLASESFGRWSAVNCFFLGMAGFASGGTDMVLTGSVAVDLGDPQNCISGVAGTINGFGVLGGVVQGGLVALTRHWFGRSGLTLLFGGLAALPILVSGRARKLDKKAIAVVSFLRQSRAGKVRQ